MNRVLLTIALLLACARLAAQPSTPAAPAAPASAASEAAARPALPVKPRPAACVAEGDSCAATGSKCCPGLLCAGRDSICLRGT